MCLLRVSAKRDTLSDFLSATGMPYCSTHDRGTLHRFGHDKGKPFGYSGFRTWVSRKKWSDLPGQVSDAIRFLRRHKVHLNSLRNKFQAYDMRLDFPYFLRIGKNNIVVQSDVLPAKLVALAGELGIGIEMSLYSLDHWPRGRKKLPSDRPVKRKTAR